MNKIEKLVYDAVKKNQHLKAGIRNIYQTVFDLLPDKKNYSKNPIQAKEGFYFGFHDVCPFSHDDSKLLGNQLTIPFRMNTAEDVLHVGYFDHKNGELGDYIQIGQTYAWNYHKGCRLQWVGKDKLIYNAVVDEKQLVSKIFDIETQQETVIPFPIDHVSHDGAFATTFNYGRLERYMPGYGYAGITEDNHYNAEKIPERTGLFIGNLETGQKEMLISLMDLTKVGELAEGFEEYFHYVTHSLFSSDDRYISFLHRWVDEFDTFNRHSRLISYDRLEKKCHVAPTNDMVSHYVWNNQNQIVAFCRIGDIDCHVLFKEPTLQDYEIIAYPRLNSDGHQSFITSNSFVTDTYPNRSRMANLYKVDATTNEVEHLASLKSFKQFQSQAFKHWGCDFHPRMNRKGDVVCFDSVHTGQRALCVMKID